MENDKYIGRLLDGRYEILEVIGTGGMAVVYKARCHRLNRLVAIKILKDDYLEDEEFRRRFHAEGEAVAMLSHPNIVSVYDVSSSPQADFIVMELIDGITLKQYMEKKGYLNWKETLHFAIQIAKALEHAHSRGIVHRDIKPHNVMVLKNGSVKVADFGIARVMSKSNTLTKEALGSVHYISPEQAKGGRVDNRSDIYSLGIVMYEMIAGRVPYDAESPVSVAIQHINGGAPSPSHYNPNIPKGLEQIIVKAIALAPADRYDTATAMLYDMDEFRKNPGQVLPVETKPQTVPQPVRPTPTQQNNGRSIAERTAHKKESPGAKKSKGKEPTRNRVATVALVACVIVSVVALMITLLVFFLDSEPQKPPVAEVQLVEVPYLLGAQFDTLEEYPDLKIEFGGSEINEEYEENQIIRQRPAPGTKVTPGTSVYVTVSLGKAEKPSQRMEDLTGKTVSEARIAINGWNMGLQIQINEETNSELEEGIVIRTEPAAETVLTDGQNIVLWVSKGPEVVKEHLPNVVGRNVEDAIAWLEECGFKNVIQNPVDNTAPKGEVVGQSGDRDEKIDVTTQIVLDVSTGVSHLPPETTLPEDTEETDPEETKPKETKPEQTRPTETEPPVTSEPPEETIPEGTVRMEYAFLIPSSTEQYELSIHVGGEVFVKAMTVQPGVSSVTIPLVGNGTVDYELYINGEFLRTETVEFEPDE